MQITGDLRQDATAASVMLLSHEIAFSDPDSRAQSNAELILRTIGTSSPEHPVPHKWMQEGLDTLHALVGRNNPPAWVGDIIIPFMNRHGETLTAQLAANEPNATSQITLLDVIPHPDGPSQGSATASLS